MASWARSSAAAAFPVRVRAKARRCGIKTTKSFLNWSSILGLERAFSAGAWSSPEGGAAFIMRLPSGGRQPDGGFPGIRPGRALRPPRRTSGAASHRLPAGADATHRARLYRRAPEDFLKAGRSQVGRQSFRWRCAFTADSLFYTILVEKHFSLAKCLGG